MAKTKDLDEYWSADFGGNYESYRVSQVRILNNVYPGNVTLNVYINDTLCAENV